MVCPTKWADWGHRVVVLNVDGTFQPIYEVMIQVEMIASRVARAIKEGGDEGMMSRGRKEGSVKGVTVDDGAMSWLYHGHLLQPIPPNPILLRSWHKKMSPQQIVVVKAAG